MTKIIEVVLLDQTHGVRKARKREFFVFFILYRSLNRTPSRVASIGW